MAFGPEPSWAAVTSLAAPDKGHHGDPHGQLYSPPSCDAVLREHCWFGSKAYPPGHCKLSSTANLVRKYLTSVGRSCNLILNIAPDTKGGVAGDELKAYASMGTALTCLFSKKVASTGPLLMGASGAIEWLLPPTGAPCENCSLVLMEDITQGQLIGNFSLLCQNECRAGEGFPECVGGEEPWEPCALGSLDTDGPTISNETRLSSIGNKRILMLSVGSPLLALRVVVTSNFAMVGQVPKLRAAELYDFGGVVESCFESGGR